MGAGGKRLEQLDDNAIPAIRVAHQRQRAEQRSPEDCTADAFEARDFGTRGND